MKENNFLTYRKFSDRSDATELTNLLIQNSVEFVSEDASASFDPSFANNKLNQEYRIKLKKSDFEKADKIQIENSQRALDTVARDYYLLDFTDQELLEVLTRRDEWSTFDYLLAQKILGERGKAVSSDLLDTLRKQRIEELGKPEDRQRTWIIAGYVFSILGGLLGIFIGWHLHFHKKTLPNGDRVHGYSAPDRKHGLRILIVAVIFSIIWIYVRIGLAE